MKNQILTKTTFCLASLLLCIGCAKSNGQASSAPPTKDVLLTGFWRLDTSSEAFSEAPRILKLQVNGNSVRQADYCDIGGLTGQGMSGYDLDGDQFSISYYTFKDPAHPAENEMPTTERKLSGKITKLDGKVLVLDGKTTFRKFVPTKNSALTDNSSTLCE
jgi:hypothetical protein